VKTRDENVSVSFRIARLAFSSLSRETRRSRMRDLEGRKVTFGAAHDVGV